MFNLEDSKILIIAPHPDDEALWCGGLIMLAKKKKAEVLVIYMSTGDSRQFVTGQTYETIRLQETIRASTFGGFQNDIGFTGTSTKADLIPQKDMIELIEDKVDEFKPDVVVVPYQKSYNQDHRAIAQASITALRPIPQSLHHQPKVILEMEESCQWPIASNPNFFVDITDFFEDKLELYACHKTQLVEEPHYRSNANLRALASFRGSEIGVKYAEGYTLLKGQL